jgi:hypothetical protein
MTNNYQKTNHTLPADVHAAIAELSEDTETRNQYFASLRAAEWTLQSISDASGLTRERVRQIVSAAASAERVEGLPYPEPPKHAVKEPRVFVEPAPDKLARLLELQPAAQKSRGLASANRDAGDEYTRLVAEVHLEDGVTLYRLAKRLGVTHGALRFRLARRGFKAPKKSGTLSKVYSPILTTSK